MILLARANNKVEGKLFIGDQKNCMEIADAEKCGAALKFSKSNITFSQQYKGSSTGHSN